MKIDATTTPVWQELALNQPGVVKFAIPRLFVKNFKADSFAPVENSGFLTGVYRDGVFYVISVNPLCSGKFYPQWEPQVREVALEPETRGAWWVFEEEVTRAFAESYEGVHTVLYHSHPNTGEDQMLDMWPEEAETYLEILEEELKAGVFDYLGVGGNRPSMDTVVNETFARQLSPKDIEHTPGNTHLLITNNLREGKPLWHLDAYKLVPQKSVIGKLDIVLTEKLVGQELRTFKEAKKKHWQAFHKVGKRHEEITERLADELAILTMRGQQKHFYL